MLQDSMHTNSPTEVLIFQAYTSMQFGISMPLSVAVSSMLEMSKP